MSDIDPTEVTDVAPADVPGRGARVVPERFREEFSELFTPPIESRRSPEREGLPPGYRMRADSHYVDQLTSRSADTAVRFISTDEIDTVAVDPAGLEALTRSIAARGVVQPLLVRRRGVRYQVIAGRKRLAAARAAGLARVPCLVHQVDDEEAAALGEADNVRGTSAPASSSAEPSPILGRVAAQLAEDVASIESSAALIGTGASPLIRRVTIDLVRAQAWRASWLLRAGAILEDTYRWDLRLQLLGAVLERVRQGMAPECRLSGIDLQVSVPDWNVSAEIDEMGLVAGLTGAIVATLGLIGPPEGAVITLMTTGSASEIDIGQDLAPVAAGVTGGFFDPSWIDRPGGWTSAIGAATARAVAERHGGAATLMTREGRGSIIRLNLGRAR